MATDFLILSQASIAGFTVYGMMLIFAKALVVVVTAQLLAEQLEFSSALVRHTIWLLGVLSLVALPVVSTFLPDWYLFHVLLPEIPEPSPGVALASRPEAPALLPTLSWFDGLMMIYLAVVVVRVVMLLMEIGRVARLSAVATPAAEYWYQLARQSIGRRITIKVSAAVDSPMTWGTLSPCILLPPGSDRWTALEKVMVIRHECGHIRRLDWLTLLLAQLVAILYWPLPGVRKAVSQLSLEAERACDNWVLQAGVSPADYAALLVHQSRENALPATVAFGTSSELVQRVKHIVSVYIDRAGEQKLRVLLTAIAVVLLLPLAAVKAVVSASSPALTNGQWLVRLAEPMPTAQAQPPVQETLLDAPQRPPAVSAPPNVALFDVSDRAYLSDTDGADTMPSVPMSRLPAIVIPDTASIKVIRKQLPNYPASARRRGIEGNVIVEFDITADGRVINPRIIQSSPGTVFNQAVLSALQQYRFEPSRIDGVPTAVTGLRRQFTFRLGDAPDRIDSS